MTTLDAKTLATADAVTRALLAESMRETLERRLAAERPHGTYDDTRAGHDAFSRGVTDDYDHGNHHLARATIRLADAIDTIAAAAINTGARLTDLTAQYIDDEKALASVGIDPWTTRPSDDPTGQADCILYVGRDGAYIHVKAGRIIVDAYEVACQRSVTGALPGYLGSWRRHITHSAQMLARVRSSLAAFISEGDDVVVHIYPICSPCADRADILGAAIALDDVGLCRGVW